MTTQHNSSNSLTTQLSGVAVNWRSFEGSQFEKTEIPPQTGTELSIALENGDTDYDDYEGAQSRCEGVELPSWARYVEQRF